MKTLALSLAFGAALAGAAPADADPATEIRALYQQFVTAQNARDLDAVRGLFLDLPKFLWISDGMAYWGRDAVLARMSSFQAAEVWHVDPALDRSVAVEVTEGAAFLHLSLVLTIGPKTEPQKFPVPGRCAVHRHGRRLAHRGAFHRDGKGELSVRVRERQSSRSRARIASGSIRRLKSGLSSAWRMIPSCPTM